jgi:hypothetical protein
LVLKKRIWNLGYRARLQVGAPEHFRVSTKDETIDLVSVKWRRLGAGSEKEAPDQKQNDCSEDGCYQSGAVFSLIPSCLLSQVRGREGANNAKEASQHEPEWSLSAGRNRPGDDAGGQA